MKTVETRLENRMIGSLRFLPHSLLPLFLPVSRVGRLEAATPNPRLFERLSLP